MAIDKAVFTNYIFQNIRIGC